MTRATVSRPETGRGLLSPVARAAAFTLVSVVLVALVVRRAREDAGEPLRCGDGFVAIGARCCGEGQTLSSSSCAAEPRQCGPDHERTPTGCVARARRVTIPGGSVRIGPSDWEAQGVVEPRTITVATFRMDVFEIDVARHAACVRAGACAGPVAPHDPGRAAVLSFDEAAAVCRSEGARLPTDDEWTFAAMGTTGRRYPWGDTGAVCGRAAFGLVTGPCARGAAGPDTVGARPAGRSPEGVHDLAGNVAEWTTLASGERRLRGGSYASALATELRGWRGDGEPREAQAGARCVTGMAANP